VRICGSWTFSLIFSFVSNNSPISKKFKTNSKLFLYSFNNRSTSSLQNEHEYGIGSFHNNISSIIYSISFNYRTALQHNFHDNKCFGEQEHVCQKTIRLIKIKNVITVNARGVEKSLTKVNGDPKIFITIKNNENAKLKIKNTDDRAANKPINSQKP
jgi:hypothetical protein